MEYASFLATKRPVVQPTGHEIADGAIHPSLFGFQRDLVRWSVRKGRAALFADTGLGKTRMQLEWARLTGHRALVLAPLAVAQQTVANLPTDERRQLLARIDGDNIRRNDERHAQFAVEAERQRKGRR